MRIYAAWCSAYGAAEVIRTVQQIECHEDTTRVEQIAKAKRVADAWMALRDEVEKRMQQA